MSRSAPKFRRRHGISLVYAVLVMVALLGLCSFAVDYGRMRVARTQLQMAADAAAMYGITGIKTSIATAQSRAVSAAADNKSDGTSVALSTNDIELGTWDPGTRTFTALAGNARLGATAMRVTTRTDVPTVFAAALGRNSISIQTSAIATLGRAFNPQVNAVACPWLAGMPNGSSVAASGGNTQASVAPAQSPYAVSGLNITPGEHLTIRLSNGTTGWGDGSAGQFGPDGDTSWIVQQAAANGINTTQAPIGSLVGIFLDNRAPNTFAQGTAGNFSTAASRDFTVLNPPLKQVFFIGDGVNSSGVLQDFVVPTGATRLYLGIMDEKGWWWDNTGTLTTTMLNDTVTLVK